VKNLTKKQLDVILYGEHPNAELRRNRFGRLRTTGSGMEGVIQRLDRLYRDNLVRLFEAGNRAVYGAQDCPACGGKRLKPESLAVTVGGLNIMDVSAMSVSGVLEWTDMIKENVLTERENIIAQQILKEIKSRLGFLRDVGLDYLTLDRPSGSLSGGEAQRIRLATQIGSGLMGVLYICDEPTVGLHPVDDSRLIQTLLRLKDLGNTILIVEHDEAMMRAADYIIDIGPGAGEHGGRIIAEGTIDDIKKSDNSITGQYLSGKKQIPIPKERRPGNGREIVIRGARENNLKNIDARIPLGKLVCVTGVSGSGKSSLVNEILYKKLAKILYRAKDQPGKCDDISGIEFIDKVVDIDQSPIGRTPAAIRRPIRHLHLYQELFSKVPEARARGYTPGRFSFNVKGGRCEACGGDATSR
jgi:excinuclease ABC subunit A